MFELKVFGLAKLLASGRVKATLGAGRPGVDLAFDRPAADGVSGGEASSRVREWREWGHAHEPRRAICGARHGARLAARGLWTGRVRLTQGLTPAGSGPASRAVRIAPPAPGVPCCCGHWAPPIVTAAVVWFLLPRTPDAFTATENALQSGPQDTTQANGLPVYVYAGPASSSPRPGPSTPTALPSTPFPVPAHPVPRAEYHLPRTELAVSGAELANPIDTAHRPASCLRWRYVRPSPRLTQWRFRPAPLASDVAKADRYSKDVAVEVANSHCSR